MPREIRHLFCTIIGAHENFPKAGEMWDIYKGEMIKDFTKDNKRVYQLTEIEKEKYRNEALIDIKRTLATNNRLYENCTRNIRYK